MRSMLKKPTKGAATPIQRAIFWGGLLFVLAYWFSLHPPGFGRLGYVEDIGSIEITRQVMADNLIAHGKPGFFTDRFGAPNGISIAFASWSLERDWLGAYFWMWNRDFPFLWVYLGASLLLTYLGSGFLIRKLDLS